ncbi:MAG: hypothetical protein ABI855_17180 [Bacteroidota bacterium]
MKNKLFVLMCSFFVMVVLQAKCQEEMKARPFNTMAFFYVDNSQNFELNALNNDLAEILKDKLKEQQNIPQHCFYFIGTNGAKPKLSYNITNFFDGDVLTKYLEKSSRAPDYAAEKSEVRDYFSNYPVKIKQTAEIYCFLSSNAVNKIMNDVELLPSPLVFPQEMLMYLNAPPEIQYHVNFYINKEITEKFPEDKIKSSFLFCSSFLNQNKIHPDFYFK